MQYQGFHDTVSEKCSCPNMPGPGPMDAVHRPRPIAYGAGAMLGPGQAHIWAWLSYGPGPYQSDFESVDFRKIPLISSSLS